MILRKNQLDAIQQSCSNDFQSGVHFHATGTGKCHLKDTLIMMTDGTKKKVQNIRVGDTIMGDDCKPRRVLSLARGKDKMYTIHQNHGMSYTVNQDHILCLQDQNKKIREISVANYISLPVNEQTRWRGYRVPIEFLNQDYPRKDFYKLGHEGHDLPCFPYSIRDRKEILAGFLDRWASWDPIARVYQMKHRKDLQNLVLSLGQEFEYIIIFHGQAILRYGSIQGSTIKVQYYGIDQYYGFTLDGNCRYLLEDGTVTHNTKIAQEILFRYHDRYPDHHVLWLCEHKFILREQFSSHQIPELKERFHVFNYTDHKMKKWYEHVNTSVFWKKNVLLIINRAFLTMNNHYEKIKIPFHLILHDESHTIVNQSTRNFYDFMLSRYPRTRCIGFSATPFLNYRPFTRILSSYSIFDAYMDGNIVPPRIIWLDRRNPELSFEQTIRCVRECICSLPFRKIIVWCGMIEHCFRFAKQWKIHFPEFLICVDTSVGSDELGTLEDFQNQECQAFLFCANKHREGSDIYHLDGCVFLDGVSRRSHKTFIQCAGRVLRIDPCAKKTHGLILDFCVHNAMQVCERFQSFLLTKTHPWDYQSFQSDSIYLHQLTMCPPFSFPEKPFSIKSFSVEELLRSFVRTCPSSAIYQDRLRDEIQLVMAKQLSSYLLKAVDILTITSDIPHITRGSCGSSLLCYLLGISHVDPVKHNIRFARFLNEFRDQLPDIDFDFPHHMRNDVFMRIEMKWPHKVARISNHVFFHEKSAIREGLRKIGIRRFIAKSELKKTIENLDELSKERLLEEVKRLDETFKHFSLHCGGIVFYPDGIPEELILKNNVIPQITCNKEEISKNKQFKIDILSSRGLAQLFQANDFLPLAFDVMDAHDSNVFEMLSTGKNIGITFAESPLIRKTFMQIKPTTLYEIAVCLAIIRPAAMEARKKQNYHDYLVFDDDAIDMISSALECSDAEADRYRRAIIKKEDKKTETVRNNETLMKKLGHLRHYSFCKSHAFSYAQLIYLLAQKKYHEPQKFWKATLDHCCSMYRKWVHFYEATLSGVPFSVHIKNPSIYSKSRYQAFFQCTPVEQMRRFGFWDMTDRQFFPDCYFRTTSSSMIEFKGLIASSRLLHAKNNRYRLILFIGTAPQHYVEITCHLSRPLPVSKYIGIEGIGRMTDPYLSCMNALRVSFF